MEKPTLSTLAIAVLGLCIDPALASLFGSFGSHSFARRQSSQDTICEAFSTAETANLDLYPSFQTEAGSFCQTLSGGELPSDILPASAVTQPLPGTNGDPESQFTSLCATNTIRVAEAEGIVPGNTATPTSALAVVQYTNVIPADVVETFTVSGSVSATMNIGPMNILQNTNNISPYDGSDSIPINLRQLFPNVPTQWLFNDTNTYQDTANIPVTGTSASYNIPADCQVTAALFVDEVQYGYVAETDLCLVGAFVCDYSQSRSAIKYYTSKVESVREVNMETGAVNTCEVQRGSVQVQFIPTNPRIIVYENNDACGGRVIAQQLEAGVPIPTEFQFPITTEFQNVVTEVEVATATDTSTITQIVVNVEDTSTADRPGFEVGGRSKDINDSKDTKNLEYLDDSEGED